MHAPMWARSVERALGAWDRHMAVLISRHGRLIYSRYTDRHQIAAADAAAVDHYLETQGPMQATWAGALGLDAAMLARDSALVALFDTLSLALCGALRPPLEVEAPDRAGGYPDLAAQGAAGGWDQVHALAMALPYRGDRHAGRSATDA